MPAVARRGDANIPHCSGHSMTVSQGSVFANNKPVVRDGDSTTGHLKPCPPPPPCCGHSSSVSSSRNVYVRGIAISTVGDGHCTAIAQGSSNVFAN